ncbi:MAG: ABC transporter permease [Prevotellaceae bacterium]|jgi:ABC-2 type transport system permease protein|nr:ABC transporter permease [Prevotellaceae bacterium]
MEYKQLVAFIKKEFRHILRDPRTMLILLGMPIIQIILFGFAISNDVKNTSIAVLDPGQSVTAQRIIKRLDASEYFNVTYILSHPKEMTPLFQEGKIQMALLFNDRFDDRLFHTGDASIQLLTDASDPNQASMVAKYATTIIASCQQELVKELRIPMQIIPEIHMLYNPTMKSAYNFVPGVMGMILILICAMMTSIAIVREKEMGTMEVLLSSPLKPSYVIFSKVIPYFALSVFNLVTILLLSIFALEVPVSGSLFWLTMLSLLFIGVALSLGILISTLVRTQVAAILISGMVLMIPVMLLSGMIFPIENMPLILQYLSNIVPAKWYIRAVKLFMIQGASAKYAIKEFAVLSVMLVVLIFISLKKFKDRL